LCHEKYRRVQEEIMLHILSSASIQRNKERILENYQKQESEHSAYIVVPEQSTMQMDVWILDELKRESLMDLRVVSFQKLSKEVLESTFGANRPYIDNIGKAMVLRTVFEDFPEECIMKSPPGMIFCVFFPFPGRLFRFGRECWGCLTKKYPFPRRSQASF